MKRFCLVAESQIDRKFALPFFTLRNACKLLKSLEIFAPPPPHCVISGNSTPNFNLKNPICQKADERFALFWLKTKIKVLRTAGKPIRWLFRLAFSRPEKLALEQSIYGLFRAFCYLSDIFMGRVSASLFQNHSFLSLLIPCHVPIGTGSAIESRVIPARAVIPAKAGIQTERVKKEQVTMLKHIAKGIHQPTLKDKLLSFSPLKDTKCPAGIQWLNKGKKQ